MQSDRFQITIQLSLNIQFDVPADEPQQSKQNIGKHSVFLMQKTMQSRKEGMSARNARTLSYLNKLPELSSASLPESISINWCRARETRLVSWNITRLHKLPHFASSYTAHYCSTKYIKFFSFRPLHVSPSLARAQPEFRAQTASLKEQRVNGSKSRKLKKPQ